MTAWEDRRFDQELRVEPQRTMMGWRAWRVVSREWVAALSAGVRMDLRGTEPPFLPFVEATGRTPQEALSALMQVLGECLVAAEAWKHRPIEVGMRADQITRTFELTLEEAQAIANVGVYLTAKLDVEQHPNVKVIIDFASEAEAQRLGNA